MTIQRLPIVADGLSYSMMTGDYLLLGDSFVKRFYRHRKALKKPFLVCGKAVEMWGWSGADVRMARRNTVLTMRRWTHSVVVMQVGSDDLCNAAHSPEHVVDDLEFLKMLKVDQSPPGGF